MAAITPNLSLFSAPSSIGGLKLPTTAKNQYVASLTSSNPLAKLSIGSNPAGLQPNAGAITNQSLLPSYLQNGGISSNGATAPVATTIKPATTSAPASSSAGSYKGTQINSGDDASVASQMAAIDAEMGERGGSTYGSAPTAPYSSTTSGTPTYGNNATGTPVNGATPTVANGNPDTANAPKPLSAYDTALQNYIAALGNSQDLNARVQKQTLDANHLYQNDLDASGGLLGGNQKSAALDARRSNSSLADLGVAETSATNAANLAFQQLQYQKGALPNNDPYTLSPGQTRFDASGKQIASLPDDGGAAPSSVKEYQYAQSQGYTGTFEDFKNSGTASSDPNRVLSASEAQSLGVPDGTTASEAYGITPQKNLTEFQQKEQIYGQRAQESGQIIDNLGSYAVNLNPGLFSTYSALEPNSVGNTIVPDQFRQMRQAERNFVTAVLRQESGATISPSEFATDEKKYFPRPGDDAKTLANKAALRNTVINAFLQSGGGSNNSTSSGGASASGFGWDGK